MKIKTGRRVIVQREKQSGACGCSGFDAETSDVTGDKKGGGLFNKAQGAFQKGKGFLDNNQGIKDTLGGILGGNKRSSNDSVPMQTTVTMDPPPAKSKLSTGAKIGIGVGVAAVIGTIIFFVAKKK